jgi:hypothetical protein
MFKELDNRMVGLRKDRELICVRMNRDVNIRGELFESDTTYELDRETGSCLISLGNAQRVRKPREGK